MASAGKVSQDFIRQLDGYGLTTAKVLYRLPDFPSLLQTYIWQDYDLAPTFPRLLRFVRYWALNLDGPIHSVEVGHELAIGPTEIRMVGEWVH